MKAAKKPSFSVKRQAIDKASAQLVATVAAAAFVTVFCLVASQALWSQHGYLSRVTKAKQQAHAQLQADLKSVNALVSAYKGFVGTSTNVIGGNTSGSGDKDGDNAKIVLDALPPAYDFPALTSSLEKIFKDNNFNVSSITGTDDQIAQQTNQGSSSPTAVPIPFSFTITNTNYSATQQLVSLLQQSIRPIQIDSMTMSGGANNMQLTVNAHTYYQPEKDFKVTTEVVK